MSDTHDHDQTTFTRSPGRASLDAVDFDVTAGFGEGAEPAEAGEFFDLTQGADESPANPAHEEIVDMTVETAAPAPAPPPSAGGAAAPAPLPEATAGGGGKLALIGAIVVALVAAALWFAMR